jgi:MFS family permease
MNAPVASAAVSRGWYHGWNIVAVCILSQVFANGLTYNSYSLFLPSWSLELNAAVSRLQLPIAAMALLASIVAPFVGSLADKFPARVLLAIGLAGMATFYLAVSVAQTTWQLVAFYGLIAPIALCLCTSVVTNALISRWFVRKLGLALGFSAFGIGMAGTVLPPIVASLLPTLGWRMIWRAVAALIVVVGIPLVLFVVRNRPTDAEGLYYLSSDGPKAAGFHGHGSGGDASQLGWREVLSRRNFWLLVAIYLPMMGLNGGTGQNLGPYAAHHGLSQQTAGVLLSVLSFSHLVATLGFGVLSDRFGNRLPFVGLAVIMVLGATTLAFGSGFPMLALGCCLIGLGGGLFTLLAAAIAVEFGAAGVGRAFGFCMLFVPLTALSPFLIAKTQESTGSYAPAFMGMAVLVAISGALSLLLRERNAVGAGAGV